jgi:hypothetical protein
MSFKLQASRQKQATPDVAGYLQLAAKTSGMPDAVEALKTSNDSTKGSPWLLSLLFPATLSRRGRRCTLTPMPLPHCREFTP